MRFLIVFLIFAASQNTFSQGEKSVIVLERRTQTGVENMGLVLSGEKIQLSSNSNFLMDFPEHFGLFEITASSEIKKQIAALSKKKDSKEKEIYESPHNLVVYINGLKINASSSSYQESIDLVKNTFKDKNLKMVDGIIFQSAEDYQKTKCENVKEDVCTFKYGFIRDYK